MNVVLFAPSTSKKGSILKANTDPLYIPGIGEALGWFRKENERKAGSFD